MAQDRLAAPTPLEEHRKLAALAGEWNGKEMVQPSRWTAGGPATSHVVARMDLNGFYLIQDTRQMRDGRESFATHGVFTYDREDRHYKLFWHDSLGYYAPAPASGGWTGKTLILVRGSLRGNARHVYEVVDDNNYTMKIQFSPDEEGFSVDMRFGAALISAQMLASVASAETLPEKMASLLQDVCVSPASSEARMAAGEKAAATENWKVI